MAEIIDDEKLPWPSQLADLSFRYLLLGLFIAFMGLPLTSLGPIAGFILISGAGIVLVSSICSIITFIGLLFHKFRIPGTGKTILTIILSYPIFALGFAIISPAFFAARTQAKSIICKSNLKQMSFEFITYQEEDTWSSNLDWCDLIEQHVGLAENCILQCPIDKTGPCSYAINKNIPADVNELPDDLVIFFESAPGWNQVGGADDVITDRHGQPGANIGFADGSVEFVKPEEISNLRWTVEQAP